MSADIVNIDNSNLDVYRFYEPVDASSLEVCQTSSVKSAKCLSSDTFVSTNGVLASFYDINWALGTLGLEDNLPVMVFADNALQRDSVVAILFLSGHQDIGRWQNDVQSLKDSLGEGTGQGRGITRSTYYSGEVRHDYLTLQSEVVRLERDGWLPGNSTDSNSNKERILVKEKSVHETLAKFTELQVKNNAPSNQLRLLVDGVLQKQKIIPPDGNSRVFGIVLLLLAGLLALTAFFMARRRV